MAIKIKGDTIIDDGRVLVNADKIGIGTTNPQVALEIFSGDVGIGTNNPSAANIETALNTNTNVLAVGIVTANEIFGDFKGTIDDGVGIDRADKVKIVSNSDNAVKYLSFVDTTGDNGFGTIFYNTNITYNPNFDNNDNGELNIDGNVKIDGRVTANDFLNVNSVGIVTAGRGLRVTQRGIVVNSGISTFGGNLEPPVGNTDTYNIGQSANLRWNQVYAKEYYGTFKGTIDPAVADNKIEQGDTKAEVIDTNGNGHFLVETEGSERLRITPDGYVGIGTDLSNNATHLLHIYRGTGCGSQSSGIGEVVIESNNAATIQLLSPSDNVNPQSIYFGDEFSGQVGRIQYDHSDDSMLFKTNGNNRRFRLNSSGDADFTGSVGIGTTNPNAPVLSSNNAKLAVGIVTAREYYGTFKGTVVPETAADRIEQGNTKAQVVDTDASGPGGHFLVETGGTEKFRITGIGSVGIGTEQPINKLQVGVGTQSFNVTGIGSVGIGARFPSAPLQIYATAPTYLPSNEGLWRFRIDTDVSDGAGFFQRPNGDFEMVLRDASDNVNHIMGTDGALTFTTSGTEKVRITSTGNVGIGTTVPTDPVHSTNNTKLAVGIVTAREYYGTTFYGNLVGGISNTGDVTITGNLEVEGNTTLGDAVGDTLTVNATPTFKENATFEKNVQIDGVLTYEDVTNVDSIGIVTAGKGLRVTQGGIKVNAGITTLMDNVGIGTEDPNSNMNGKTGTTLAVAGIVTANEYYGTFKGTIDDTTVNTFSISNNIEDIFSVASNVLSADDPEGDRIVFWDDSESKLTYLTVGNGLDITGTQITATSDAGKTYNLNFEGTQGGGSVGIVTWTLSDGTSSNDDPVTLKAGSNISISNVGTSDFTIEAVQGAGVGIAASASAVLNVNGGNIGGVNPGLSTDALVYWHEDETYTGGTGKLDHLKVGSGLEIVNNELQIDSTTVGKTYELPVTVEGGTTSATGIATIILRETSNNVDDDVTIEAGDGIVIKSITGGEGFEISADISGGGGGGIADVQVKQYSDNANPRTERSSTNPIDVQKSVGIVTIGIGTTSNAYGNRFVGPNTPSGAIEGDIWYDTTTTGQGTNRVAVLRDEKASGTYGGRPGEGEYVGYRAYNVPGANPVNEPNSWFPRNINTKYDPNSFVSVGIGSTNAFGLEAGSYKINWRVPGFHCDAFQSRIAYNTNSDFSGTTTYYYGSSQYSGNYPTPGNWSDSTDESEGEFITTISATTYFRIEQWIGYAPPAVSGGLPDQQYSILGGAIGRSGLQADGNAIISGIGNSEVYTQIRIEDLATAIKDDGNTNKIIQGDTKAEVLDTGTDGKFAVTTNGTERVVVDPSGYLLAKSDIRVRREGGAGGTQNNGAIYFGDSNNNYMFGEDKVEVLTFNSGGSNNFIVGEQVADTSGDTAYVKTWDSTTYKLTIHDRSGSFQDGETVTGQTSGAAWVIASGGLTSSGSNLLTFGTNGTEKLRITDNGSVNIGGNYTQTTHKLQITGNVKINGTITYEDVTNVNSVGIITAAGFHATGATFDSGTETDPTNVALMIEKDDYIYSNDSVNSKRKLFGKTTSGIIKIGQTPTTLISGVEILPGTNGYFGVNIDATERFRVSKDGSVGVVTTANADLYVDGTTTVKALNINTLGAGDGDILSNGGSDGIFGIYNTTNSGETVFPVKDSAGNYNNILELLNDKAIIDGNVGIGNTTIPKTKLDVHGTDAIVVPVGTTAERPSNASSGMFRYNTTEGQFEGYTNSWGAIAGGGSGSGSAESFVLLPEKASTANAPVEFTGIPADAMEITVMFDGVSVDGNDQILVQLGTSSGYITSGYDSSSEAETGGTNVPTTAGFIIFSNSSAFEHRGSMIINKASSNSYTEIGQFKRSNSSACQCYGSLSSVSGTVDRLRVIRSASAGFDAGTISVSYKTPGGGSTTGKTKIAIIQDEKPNTTNGGIVSAVNTWLVRDLNAVTDPNSVGISSVSDGKFSLPAGSYAINFSAPAMHVDEFQARLAYNTNSDFTGTTNYVYGSSEFSGFTASSLGDIASHSSDRSRGEAVLTLSQLTYFRIEQSFETSPADGAGNKFNYALGVDAHRGNNEVYTQVRVQDLATAIKEQDTGTTKVAILRDEKNANVGSGTGAANTWIDRDITVKNDPHSFVTLNARVNGQTTVSTATLRGQANGISYFALPAGTYKIKFRAVGYYISQHQAAMVYSSIENTINKVYATTDNVTKIYGTSETSVNNTTTSDSSGTEVVTINQTTYFKVIHYTVSTFGQSDFGQSGSPDKNVYLEIEVEDLKTAVKLQDTGTTKVAVVKDQKNYNVDAGTFTQNAWRDRDLTVKDDPFNFVTLYPTANGQTTASPGNDPGYFSLLPGKYKIRFSAPAFKVDSHMAAMVWSSTESNISKTYATTDARDGESYGSSEISQDDNGRVSNDSKGTFVVEITQTSYFKVIHYCKDTQSSNGFGESASIGSTDPETYTIVEVEDLATAVKSGVNASDKIEEGNTKAEVIDTGTDGHFKVTTEGEEKLRITSDGDAIITQNVASSSVSGGGIYTRTLYMGQPGAQNGVSYTINKDFFTFYCENGAIAGTVYAAVNGNYLSASFTAAFCTQDGADTINFLADRRIYISSSIYELQFEINHSGTYNNYHTFRLTNIYTHNGASTGNPSGPSDPYVTLTVVMGAANKPIIVTRP